MKTDKEKIADEIKALGFESKDFKVLFKKKEIHIRTEQMARKLNQIAFNWNYSIVYGYLN